MSLDLDSSKSSDAEYTLEAGVSKRCTHVLVRQEWRALSDTHKAEYIRAVKCTQRLPNITSYHGAQSRFDDFQAVHIHTADSVHHVGHFLPWHRGFVSLYEKTLRDDCDYRGAIPYWDWTQDVSGNKSLLSSPLFDPYTGFGGDGVPGTYTVPPNAPESSQILEKTFVGCVLDGPFAHNITHPDSKSSFAVHLGPGKMVTTHCLVRGFDDRYEKYLSSDVVKNALAQSTYEKFRMALENDPEGDTEKGRGKGGGESATGIGGLKPSEHTSGHLAIGGDLGNLYSSPGDPLFFLHHANIDRIWWLWQTMDLENRLLDMSGSVIPPEDPYVDDDTEGTSADEAEEMPNLYVPEDEDGYDGIDIGNSSAVALDSELRFGAFGRTIPIRELMDITQFPLCYQYL